MEFPQPRPFGAQGTRAIPTHDFLSHYGHSTPRHEYDLSFPGYLKTHDFLQPLEPEGKTRTKEETTAVKNLPSPSVQNILPGGIGTYTIGPGFNQRVSKPELTKFKEDQIGRSDGKDDSSNCSSFSGSGFKIWENTATKKGKTWKEKVAERPAGRYGTVKVAQCMLERPSLSSWNNHRNSFNSHSSSQSSGQKNHSFMEMIRYAKDSTKEDEMHDDDAFILKKEPYFIDEGELRVEVVGKSTDQKANTPRSKHSATEQRRRSKINTRFQMLREIIPHTDQKRDKASILLEVIEYIQFLQEKVHKYEGSNQGRNSGQANMTPLRNNHGPSDSFADQSQGINCGPSGPALIIAAKCNQKTVIISPTIRGNEKNPVESEMSTGTVHEAISHHPGMENKRVPFPVSLQSNIYSRMRSGSAVPLVPHQAVSDAENMGSQQIHKTRLCGSQSTAASVKMKNQDLTIQGGEISIISSVYSQGLLNTLRQELQKSGVDLSQASISVQIELGKRADSKSTSKETITKDNAVASKNGEAKHSIGDDTGPIMKRLKTG